MTREEAIKEIIRAYDVLDFSCHMDNRRKESFNMAKVALEQESILDKIRAEIKYIIDNTYDSTDYDNGAYRNGLYEALDIIDKHKVESEETE